MSRALPGVVEGPAVDRGQVSAPVWLAGRLRTLILAGAVPSEQPLPAERDLAQQHAVSRSTVREALLLLKNEGLIETRIGRGGGSFIRRSGTAALDAALAGALNSAHPDPWMLSDALTALEPQCAGLAALRRDDVDLRSLRRADSRMRAAMPDPAGFGAAHLAWHITVADSARNDVLSSLVRTLRRSLPPVGAPSTSALCAHAAVTDAIARSAAAEAERLARTCPCTTGHRGFPDRAVPADPVPHPDLAALAGGA